MFKLFDYYEVDYRISPDFKYCIPSCHSRLKSFPVIKSCILKSSRFLNLVDISLNLINTMKMTHLFSEMMYLIWNEQPNLLNSITISLGSMRIDNCLVDFILDEYCSTLNHFCPPPPPPSTKTIASLFGKNDSFHKNAFAFQYFLAFVLCFGILCPQEKENEKNL